MSKKDKKFIAVYKEISTGTQIERTVMASDILEAAGQFDLIELENHTCISISLSNLKNVNEENK